ncbi:hypothetical protein ACFW17_11105, partial [Streptomyces sp. NPDC058961]
LNGSGGRGGGGGRPVEDRGLGPGAGSAQPKAVAEPAIAEPGQLPLRNRPSLQAVGTAESPAARTVDLTAEDDTQALPRLDSLERKLKDLEQQFG